VLLNVPPPEIIDQAPVVALLPNTAPVNALAEGIADWHVLIAPPAETVGNAFTVTN
jgi:hypothetical protein